MAKYRGQLKSSIKTISDFGAALKIIQQDRTDSKLFTKPKHRQFCYTVLDIVLKQITSIRDELIAIMEEEQLLFLNRSISSIEKYRYNARFNINVNNIHLVKGYDLLLKFGKYDPKFNPLGVVKDHRVSIKYGFDNNIDPKIIGHIKNCEFIQNHINLSKSFKSSISLKVLLYEIGATDELDKQAKLL